MANQVSHYRPLFQHYQLNDNTYYIVDSTQAERRALYFHMFAQSREVQPHKVDYYLSIATDYGCSDAPYELAKRIIGHQSCPSFNTEDAIILLNIAAQRGNQRAAYEMACCYAGKSYFPDILAAGVKFFASLSNAERELLAKYYFSVAENTG